MNEMSLKARIRNIAKKKGITAQQPQRIEVQLNKSKT
jgi:hypothetical protein